VFVFSIFLQVIHHALKPGAVGLRLALGIVASLCHFHISLQGCGATKMFVSITFLQVIHHALKPGGAWINVGPLLYHWADGHGDVSCK
jgi:hypothetical protein